MTTHLKLVTPSNVNRRVAVRPPNAELRPREYLTVAEVERLIKAAKSGRYGHRDATLILIAFRHGLRAIEIAGLQWSQVEFGRNAALHVRRAKNGTPAFTRCRGTSCGHCASYTANARRRSCSIPSARPASPRTPSTCLVKTIGKRAGLPFSVHVHMLRHACGYALANAGHDTRRIQSWLGHRSIQHTVRYTELTCRAVQGVLALSARAFVFQLRNA